MTALTLVAPSDGPLERARRGDEDAFARLVERHEAMVFSIAFHSLGERDRAEEIAQDVFLQLYRRLGDVESETHLLFWLRQVTSRRCIDEIRRRRSRRVPFDEVNEPAAVTQASPDPLRDALLRRLVAELPDSQRIVITLRYQEDLDPAEICGIVGMPVNTVKSHLHRGLKALRKRLGDRS